MPINVVSKSLSHGSVQIKSFINAEFSKKGDDFLED